jgi:predicted RNase H-like HicB family nuclease
VYRVTITREDDQWLASVEDVPGAHTYARSLSALIRYVREVIVLGEDLSEEDADSLMLALVFKTGLAEIDDIASHLRDERAELRRRAQVLQDETAALAKRLVDEGWSVRDAATALDIAPQRVSQLTSSR